MLFIKRFKNFLNPFKQRIFGTFHKNLKIFFYISRKQKCLKNLFYLP